jgi:dephospho-CoA kinase
MISIGITGIIGSGKTTVCKIFDILGIPVYNADINAKKLMLSDNHIKKNMIKHFGQDIYSDNGINKPYLSNRIFNSEQDRELVNSIVHPAVIKDFTEWKKLKQQKIVAIETALLYEAKIDKITDCIILVKSPKNILLQRIMQRDNISETDAEKRINSQSKNIPEKSEQKLKIIINDGKKSLIEQCLEILKTIK